jgi:hypothetical protein
VNDGRLGTAYGPAATNADLPHFIPGNQADLNFDPTADEFTITTWFRTSTTTNYHILFGKDGGDPYRVQYRAWIVDPATRLSAVTGEQYGRFIETDPPLNNGRWHMATLVNFNDNGTFRTRLYYNDGTQFAEYNTGSGGTVPDLLRIGAMSAGYNEWHGQLDDFRIYRRALSQEEIASLYDPPAVMNFQIWMDGIDDPPPAHLGGPLDDADQDGHNNLLEYALGSHPNNSSSIVVPAFERNGNTVTLSYPRLRENLQYVVQFSPDLDEWHTTNVDQDITTPIGETATATFNVPADTDQIFLRLCVEEL